MHSSAPRGEEKARPAFVHVIAERVDPTGAALQRVETSGTARRYTPSRRTCCGTPSPTGQPHATSTVCRTCASRFIPAPSHGETPRIHERTTSLALRRKTAALAGPKGWVGCARRYDRRNVSRATTVGPPPIERGERAAAQRAPGAPALSAAYHWQVR